MNHLYVYIYKYTYINIYIYIYTHIIYVYITPYFSHDFWGMSSSLPGLGPHLGWTLAPGTSGRLRGWSGPGAAGSGAASVGRSVFCGIFHGKIWIGLVYSAFFFHFSILLGFVFYIVFFVCSFRVSMVFRWVGKLMVPGNWSME